MKFVCDKCNTKYSIADEKVRRKVLKIRCKNCSHIIVVRELSPSSSEVAPLEPERSAGRVLDRAFEGAFRQGGRQQRPSQTAPALKPSPSPMLISAEHEDAAAEPTRLSAVSPDFLGGVEGGAGALDDEWYLAIDGSQFGPMGFAELCSRVKRGEAAGEAYVWRDGFDDWLELGDVPELKPYVPRIPPPPPRGKSGLFPSPMMPLVPPSAPVTSPPMPSPYMSGVAVPAIPTPATALPAVPAMSLPQASYMPRSTLPPGTAAPSLPLVPSPATPDPSHDSGLIAVPIPPAGSLAGGGVSGGNLLPVAPSAEPFYPAAPSAPLAAPRPTSSTPLLLKITAGAGILSLLCGVALVAYFIFFDRPAAKPPRVAAVPAATEPAAVQPVAAGQPRPQEPAEEFQPMEITHSEPGGKERPARAHAPRKTVKVAAASAPPPLSEEQRRLKELYGDKEHPAAKVATPVAPPRRPSGPRRPITENDILGMQRKHRSALTACYDRALKRDDTLAELKAEVTITIAENGMVKSVSIAGVRDDELMSCLRKNIRFWVFEPIGEEKQVRFPIIFRGS